MPFYFTCPYCFKKTLVDESLAGQEGPCAGCAKAIKVPEPPRRQPTAAHPVDGHYVPPRRERNTALVGWLIKGVGLALGVGIVSLLSIYLLWPSFQGLKSRRDKAACMANLQRIADALNEYAAEYGTYPPPTVFDATGKPMHSWRVLILPQLGETALHAQYDFEQAWDSSHNAAVLPHCPSVYISPGSDDVRNSSEANYVLITGKGTLFPPTGPLRPSDIQDPKDGTLLVVETQNSFNEWTKPMDLDKNKMNTRIGKRQRGKIATTPTSVGGNHDGGATVVFADGTAAWLPIDLAPELLEAMISPAGGEPINPDDYWLK